MTLAPTIKADDAVSLSMPDLSTADGTVRSVGGLLARTANSQSPHEVGVSRPSDALVARARAESALNSLFLGLGAISLLVGTVGVANTP